MVVKSVALLGAAVYTRDQQPGQDYSWYIKAGDLQLFDKIDEIYRLALRDVEGEAPKLAVIIKEQRIGLLIGDMPCQRIDHANRMIHETLYLEFDAVFQKNVLHAVAMLLLGPKNHYKRYEKHFTDYAEILFYNSSHATELVLKTVKLPIVSQQPDFYLTAIEPNKKLALFSNPENRNRCARYLIHSMHMNTHHFSFISTGRLSLDKCYQIAHQSEECILLTLSQEAQTEVNLQRSKLSFLFRQKMKFLVL
jgi:hypothetical protein